MIPFSTEFPVRSITNRADFVAEIVGWLRGTKYSVVLDSDFLAELEAENVHLRAKNGEELRIRELRDGKDWTAVGFRYDFPDPEGRLWRTEGVLRRSHPGVGTDLVRIRTQCSARIPGARIDIPRKPYIVKSLLKNEWGHQDGLLLVRDKPFWLEDGGDGLALAEAVTLGNATQYLPTIYVSASGENEWPISVDEIEKLAYDLGGVAHVVVEPSRNFSFSLRDASGGRNAYNGALGLIVPVAGLKRRYQLNWQITNSHDLTAAVREAASSVRAHMHAVGWDWTELQEQALRAQREREKKRLSAADAEALYLEEISNLKERISELEARQEPSVLVKLPENAASLLSEDAHKNIGKEIYEGEISDRLVLSARIALHYADNFGLDVRSRAIFGKIIDRVSISADLGELLEDIERATKDSKRISADVASLLSRHGYISKSQNKHVRLEAAEGFDGLESITVPTSPSDHRSLKNLRKQIERTLGLTKLMPQERP